MIDKIMVFVGTIFIAMNQTSAALGLTVRAQVQTCCAVAARARHYLTNTWLIPQYHLHAPRFEKKQGVQEYNKTSCFLI